MKQMIMNKETHLLDDLTARVGCNYLSDLRLEELRPLILHQLPKIDHTAYSLKMWSEAIHYIIGYKADFLSSKEARDLLCQTLVCRLGVTCKCNPSV